MTRKLGIWDESRENERSGRPSHPNKSHDSYTARTTRTAHRRDSRQSHWLSGLRQWFIHYTNSIFPFTHCLRYIRCNNKSNYDVSKLDSTPVSRPLVVILPHSLYLFNFSARRSAFLTDVLLSRPRKMAGWYITFGHDCFMSTLIHHLITTLLVHTA
jgi:hypothetical protein